MTHDEKLAAAIAWLGKRWCLHAANRIPRGDYSTPNNRTVDVSATFTRARKRMTKEAA